MKTFAVIENEVVTNIIVCDDLETAEQVTQTLCIEYTEDSPVHIGWIYDGENFINPTTEDPVE